MSDAQSSPGSSPIATFEIRCTRYLNAEGALVAPLPAPLSDPEVLRALYRVMVRARVFDHRAIALQRTGRIGTYGSCLGQEAVAAAIGHAMRAEDVLLPTYREYAAQFQRGVDMADILLYWGGDERGMAFASASASQDFPVSVPVASHAAHAVGVAYALKLRREARVAVCVLGDGATSKGDFYEALNAAGVWQLPLVMVVNNNQWAISVPRALQSHAETLAQKAVAAGIPGEQADGNDVIAAREVIGAAIERARTGGGPSLVEALTYRLSDHTTADDASRYRSADEVQAAWQKEPVRRLRTYLASQQWWDEAQEKALLASAEAEVDAAIGRYEGMSERAAAAMFDKLHAELPASLAVQRSELDKACHSEERSDEESRDSSLRSE